MKKYTLLLPILAAVLILTGCRQQPAATEPPYTVPTPPSISESKTPLEQLQAALEKTKSALSCTIEYGKVITNGETEEKSDFSQTLSGGTAFDWNALYAQLPDFPMNEDLLAQFCAYPLRAIPSNDGTIRYEVTDLTGEELSGLMYGDGTALKGEILGTVSITVDKNGRLSRLEFLAETLGSDGAATGSTRWFLAVTDMQLA